MSIRVITLGTLRVTQGDRILSALPSQRLRAALLIHLAVVRETSRDRLLAMFWPERSEEKARHALSQNIYELRRVLGDDWVEVRGEQIIIARDVSVDVVAFDEAVERSDYAGALSVYRGQFLDGFYLPDAHAFGTWVDAQRMKTQRQHRRARREYIRQLVDLARMREATIAAREWVAIDPGDDEGQHRLIELLADAGDRAGAIRQYESYERMLRPDGLEPLEETRVLIDRIRGGSVGDLPGIPVRAVNTPAPPALPRPVPVEPVRAASVFAGMTTTPPAARRRTVPMLALIVVIAVAVTSAWLYTSRANTPENPASTRVAVLYFQDNSDGLVDQTLASAITEALIGDFSNIDTTMMVVRSASAVERFRKVHDIDSIRKALGVDLIIEGQVTQAAGRVRVTSSLVDARSGAVIANVPFERANRDRFELIDEISNGIGTRLRQEIGLAADAGRRRTHVEMRIRSAVLAAREIAHHGMLDVTSDTYDVARHELDRADSMLAAAERIDKRSVNAILERARLTEKRTLLELYVAGPEVIGVWLDSLINHADRALKVDPRNATAFEMRGVGYDRLASFGDVSRVESARLRQLARRDLEQALTINPRLPLASARLATILYHDKKYEQAIDAAQRSFSVDPYAKESSEALNALALSHFENGDDAKAMDACREGARRFVRSHMFVMCQLWVGAFSQTAMDPDSAWALAKLVSPTTSKAKTERPVLDMLVAVMLARDARKDSAIAVIDRAAGQETSSLARGWLEPVARAYAGQSARAAVLLKREFDTNGMDMYDRRVMSYIRRDPVVQKALGSERIGSGS